jgi:hypothetical protein
MKKIYINQKQIMTESKTTQDSIAQGLTYNKYFLYTTIGALATSMLNNLLLIPYASEVKNVTTEYFNNISMDNYNKEMLKDSFSMGLGNVSMLQTKYAGILSFTSLLSFIGFALSITGLFFLIKTVLNYYRRFVSTTSTKPSVTTSGAAWGWGIPFLNLVRPFNTMNEVLVGEANKEKDSQVRTAQFCLWAGIGLAVLSGFISFALPVALYTAIVIVVLGCIAYTNYVVFQIHNRILEKQNSLGNMVTSVIK